MKIKKVILRDTFASQPPEDCQPAILGPDINKDIAMIHNLHGYKTIKDVLRVMNQSGWVTVAKLHKRLIEKGVIKRTCSVDAVCAWVTDLRKCGYYIPLARCIYTDGSVADCYRLKGWSEQRCNKHAKEVRIVKNSIYRNMKKPDLIVMLERAQKQLLKIKTPKTLTKA